MNPKELHAKMQALLADMDTISGEIEKLGAGEENADAVKSKRAEFDGKKVEFDGLKVKADDLVARAKRIADAKRVAELAEASSGDEGNVLPGSPDKPKAKAVDFAAKSLAHETAFFKYVRNSSRELDPDAALTGQERELLIPKSAKLRQGDAENSVLVPRRLVMAMLGNSETRKAAGLRAKAILSSDAIGGAGSGAASLVAPDYHGTLLQLGYDVPNLMDLVSIIPSNGGTATWPSLTQTDGNEFGGVSVSWISEGAAKPETEPTFAQKQITPHEVACYTELGDRMLSRSSIDLEALIVALFGGALRLELDNVIMNGTGTGQPTGIVNTVGVRTVARQTAGTVSDVDLVNLKYAVKPAHRGGANYAIADGVEQKLSLALDSVNRPLFRAATSGGPYDRLNGYPYRVATNAPAVGSTGDVAFGNFRAYFLALEEEVTIAKSEHYKFRNNVTCFKGFAVAGGRLVLPRGIAILDDPSGS